MVSGVADLVGRGNGEEGTNGKSLSQSSSIRLSGVTGSIGKKGGEDVSRRLGATRQYQSIP